MNDIIYIGDVGDVGGLMDDRDILPLIDKDGAHAPSPEVAIFDKAIVVRPDIVIIIHPATQAKGSHKQCLRG